MLTTGTFGNAGSYSAPVEHPKAAALAAVSGTSSVELDDSHQPPGGRHALRSENLPPAWHEVKQQLQRLGSKPLAGLVIPPEVGVAYDWSQHPHDARVSVSRAATSS